MKQLQTSLQKLLFVALLFCGALLLSAPSVAQGNNQNQQDNSQTGVAQGILVGKGKGWIAVSVENKEQGDAQTVRLSPVWVGGLPKLGGGPDKKMLLIFEQLKKGDNLKFAWLRDSNNIYVTDIKVLPPQDEKGEGDDDDTNNEQE